MTLQCWRICIDACGNNASVIYFGGNAEDVAHQLKGVSRYHAKEIFLVNLSGYGDSSGKPSQEQLFTDGLVAYEHITREYDIRPEDIVLVGRSLGSSIAIHVNSRKKVRALVLVTPFYSVYDMIPLPLRMLFPMRFIWSNKFENCRGLQEIENPVLILAASHDEVIPLEATNKLIRCGRDNVRHETIENTNHQTIMDADRVFELIGEVLERRDEREGELFSS